MRGHEAKRGSRVWASLSKARGGPNQGPSSCRLFHYLRRPVQIPNIPAVILTITALASASHCQAPQRARCRHGPKLLFCACAQPEQEGGPAQARDLWRRRKAEHRPLPPPTGNVLGGTWPFTPEPGGLMPHEDPQPRSATAFYFVLLEEKKMCDYGIKECSHLWQKPCATELLSPYCWRAPATPSRNSLPGETDSWKTWVPCKTDPCLLQYALSEYCRLTRSRRKREKSPLLPFFAFLVIKGLSLELKTILKTFP